MTDYLHFQFLNLYMSKKYTKIIKFSNPYPAGTESY